MLLGTYRSFGMGVYDHLGKRIAPVCSASGTMRLPYLWEAASKHKVDYLDTLQQAALNHVWKECYFHRMLYLCNVGKLLKSTRELKPV